jgi:hypothetical protein
MSPGRDAFAEARAKAQDLGLSGLAVMLVAEATGFRFWNDEAVLHCERPPGVSVTGTLWRAWRLLIVLNAHDISAALEERASAAGSGYAS